MPNNHGASSILANSDAYIHRRTVYVDLKNCISNAIIRNHEVAVYVCSGFPVEVRRFGGSGAQLGEGGGGGSIRGEGPKQTAGAYYPTPGDSEIRMEAYSGWRCALRTAHPR